MIRTETDDDYHQGEGVSKTTLWTLHAKTPFHARYVAKKPSTAFDIGKAAHIAILEPETLEARVLRGPDDRRGNKWRDANDEAEATGKILLTSGDHDQAMLIRDVSYTVPELATLRSAKTVVETSAYHVDEETGQIVKVRPDLYSHHGIIADIKNMAAASPWAWQRDVGKFGYHVQHAMYSDVWAKGSGLPVDAFFFICFEKCTPPLVAVYELSPSAIAEGHAIYRHALARYAECKAAEHWPGYHDGIRQVGLRRYDYKLTPAPEGEEIQAGIGEE